MTEEEALDYPDLYRHFKGGLYQYFGVASNSVDLTEWVVYRHLWPGKIKLWIRPKEEFFGLKDGKPRFEKIAEKIDLES